MTPVDFALRGDHIALDALLKATGLASSGGDAKGLIAAGRVQVNGNPELRRGRKLRAGDVVHCAGHQVRLHGAPPRPLREEPSMDTPHDDPR